MIYEVVFKNYRSMPSMFYADIFGGEFLHIPAIPEGVRFELENNKENLWCRYKLVEIIPKLETIQSEKLSISHPFAPKVVETFSIKLHKRKGYKSPFSQQDFVTEFLSTGSRVFK